MDTQRCPRLRKTSLPSPTTRGHALFPLGRSPREYCAVSSVCSSVPRPAEQRRTAPSRPPHASSGPPVAARPTASAVTPPGWRSFASHTGRAAPARRMSRFVHLYIHKHQCGRAARVPLPQLPHWPRCAKKEESARSQGEDLRRDFPCCQRRHALVGILFASHTGLAHKEVLLFAGMMFSTDSHAYNTQMSTRQGVGTCRRHAARMPLPRPPCRLGCTRRTQSSIQYGTLRRCSSEWSLRSGRSRLAIPKAK